jgi:toxin-antitoxin system PIN domain toxin
MKKASSELLLLDVNVLLAIAWPNHQFHGAATRRLHGSHSRWASCAITQLGFVRLSSNSAVVTAARSPAEAVALLAVLVSDDRHKYLESLPSPVDAKTRADFERLLGPGQVTDAYLLGLARRNNAVLVTFDARLKALAQSSSEVEILM